MFKETRTTIGWIATVGFIGFLLLVLALQVTTLQGLSEEFGAVFTPGKDAKIGVLSLEGPILSVERYQKALRRYREQDSIEAVLIDVNSPGGGVAASQELADSIDQLTDTGKPVVASIRSVGASGAYYSAVGSDTIVANPGSIVGSIGVIMQFFQAQELMDTVGLDYEVVKSGEFKDLGSPFRDFQEEEREVLRSLIMDVYDQFLNHVLERRPGLTEEKLRSLADGRVLSGRQAEAEGLIDELGSRREALNILREEAGLSEDAGTVDFSRERKGLFDSAQGTLQQLIQSMNHTPGRFRLMYMMPGHQDS